MGFAIFRLSLIHLWMNRWAALWASRYWFPVVAATGLIMNWLPTNADHLSRVGYLFTFLFAVVSGVAVLIAAFGAMSIAAPLHLA